MSKQEYFSYFSAHHATETPQAHSSQEQRPKTSHYCLANATKLLPHIIEEYQYRITNDLLTEKIHHPKRDKLIAQSFSPHPHPQRRTVRREQTKGSEGSRHGRGGKSCQADRLYKTFDDLGSSCYNYKNDYLISLQNQRMGRRLMNTRSMVQDILTKTYYTYQIYNGKIVNKDRFLKVNRNSIKFKSCNKGFGKINNGIKSFFAGAHPEDQNDSYSHQSLDHTHALNDSPFDLVKEGQAEGNNHHGFETSNPLVLSTYGHGGLSFIITQLLIDSNPPLKPDCCLLLQVIEKDKRLAKLLTSSYAERNNFASQSSHTQHNSNSRLKDCLTTAAFPYAYVAADNGFGLKFRLKSHSHVYIRVIRLEGLEQREMGVVKLDLEPFRSRTGNGCPFQIVKQVRMVNGVRQEREVFESEFEGHLHRFKKGEIAATLRFKYQLHHRGFQRKKDGEDYYTEEKNSS